MDREVAAAGGVGGEIFLEVAGKQALWHTPSWRVLRSNAGRGGGCAARGAQGGSWVAGSKGGHRFLRFARVGDRGLPGHEVPGVAERRRTHFSAPGAPPTDTREGAPSNSTQPPPRTGTPALPYTSGSAGLTRGAAAAEVCPGLVWSAKSGGEGLAEVSGRRMG